MRKLGYTDEEITDILEADKRIDRGEKLFELDPELEAGAKKARQADRKANSEPIKRERKADDDKNLLMDALMNAVEHLGSATHKTKNAEFEFQYNGRKFKVVLSAPRS